MSGRRMTSPKNPYTTDGTPASSSTAGRTTERTLLHMVRSQPVPFPPEPLRSVVIHATRRSLDEADRQQGRRNLWLRTLDRLGLGFDS